MQSIHSSNDSRRRRRLRRVKSGASGQQRFRHEGLLRLAARQLQQQQQKQHNRPCQAGEDVELADSMRRAHVRQAVDQRGAAQASIHQKRMRIVFAESNNLYERQNKTFVLNSFRVSSAR